MLSHAWAFSRMGLLFHAWIGSLTYAISRMGLFTYGSTFSRMDWLSHVYFLTHGPFHVWVYLFPHGLALSRMLSHAWAFHVWFYLFTPGFNLFRMLSHAWAFSRMGLFFHAWIGSLAYAFSRTGLFTYGSTFSRMDRLTHVCFVTHGPFYLWVYFFTHGLALPLILSHAWAF